MITTKVAVTCDQCGHRHRIARQIAQPESFDVVCHECESVLKVVVTDADLYKPHRTRLDPAVWG